MNCLILNPVEQLDLSQYKLSLIKVLSELNIIANTIIDDNDKYFIAGDKYLHYLSFLGCSPYLNFEPRTDISLSDLQRTIADLNYIEFYFESEHYRFQASEFGIKAICPACKSRMTQWQQMIEDWNKKSILNATCPQCEQSISIMDIAWKKTAGFFQSAILFHGIQSELAVPSDSLLTQLEEITKTKWQYFYG